MKPETIRRFGVSDAIMMSDAETFISLLELAIDEFADFDSDTFNVEFTTEMKALITKAIAIPSDNVLIDIQAKETQDVNLEMIESLSEIRYAFYFIKKAFKGDTQSLNQFGMNDLGSARYSADKLILFMDDLITRMNTFSEDIIAKGYKAERLETLTNELAELRRERQEQKAVKLARPVKTAERIKVLNMIWDHMVLINDAADFVFMDSPEKRAQFNLPHSESSN